jgi:hypothetical protein
MRSLQARTSLVSLKAVLPTNLLPEADIGRAFSLGAREFVHKPMNLDDYKHAVSRMVQKRTGHDSAAGESPPS